MPVRSLHISLLLLRLGVFLVMFVWTLDKFVHPEHAAGVFEKFYGLGGFGVWPMWALGAVELVILIGFLFGIARIWTYGFVMLAHGGSTLSALGLYLQPFDHLLFFAAWPMWAACIALFLLREHDRYTLAGQSVRGSSQS